MTSQIQGRPTTAAGASSEKTTGDGGRGIAETALSVVGSVLKNGIGFSPLIRGLIGLFGGGSDEPEPAPLVKYALPQSLNFGGAETQGGITSVDYDQNGMPRAFSSADYREGSSGAAAPQITVNVQAMDSRSFMDHSNEIAAAVREAMLNLNSINDVVADL
jgi:hypothetical protein